MEPATASLRSPVTAWSLRERGAANGVTGVAHSMASPKRPSAAWLPVAGDLAPSALPLLGFFVAYQFLHWMKPSEPYLVDYAREHGGIADDVTVNTVYPWSTYTLLPATVLSAALYEVAGSWVALAVAAVADVFSVALVIPATAANLAPFIASEFAFSASFASLFLVSATLASRLPPSRYQQAASWNRAATLLSTMASALIGQALVSAGHLPATITTSLIFSVASGGLLAAAAAWEGGSWCQRRWGGAAEVEAPAAVAATPPPSTSARWERLRQSLQCIASAARDPTAAALGLLTAVFLATHMLALTYWQTLLESLAPAETYNGAVLAAAYAVSAITTWLPSLRRVDDACVVYLTDISLVNVIVAGGALFTMGATTSFGLAAGAFVLYHATTEGAMVILNAQLGRRVAALAAAAHPSAPSPMLRAGEDGGLTTAAAGDDAKDAGAFAPSAPPHAPLIVVHQETQRHGRVLLADPLSVAVEADGDAALRSPLLLSATRAASAAAAASASGLDGAAATGAHLPAPASAASLNAHQPHLAGAVGGGLDKPPPPTRARFGAVFGAVTLLAQALQVALQYSIGRGGADLPLARRYLVFGSLLWLVAAGLAVRWAQTAMCPGGRLRGCCGRR